MGKRGVSTLFTRDWFLKRNYTENADGTFSPPAFKNPFTTPKNTTETIIPKQKVVETVDFHKTPVTEWFIGPYNVPSKKNSRQNFVRNGKQISIPSKLHSEYVKVTAMQYKVYGTEFKRSVEALKLVYPLYVEFTFIRGSKHRFDYCNAAQTCEDLMVANGWIEDDAADYIIPVFKLYEYDKNRPGVRIKLLTK